LDKWYEPITYKKRAWAKRKTLFCTLMFDVVIMLTKKINWWLLRVWSIEYYCEMGILLKFGSFILQPNWYSGTFHTTSLWLEHHWGRRVLIGIGRVVNQWIIQQSVGWHKRIFRSYFKFDNQVSTSDGNSCKFILNTYCYYLNKLTKNNFLMEVVWFSCFSF